MPRRCEPNVNLAELGRLTGITRGHLRQLKTNSFEEKEHGLVGMLVPGDFDHSVTGEKSQILTSGNDQKSHLHHLINRFPERLDYLLRDSFVIGFSSVDIDYKRLLSAVCVAEKKSDSSKKLVLAFNKSALSTLESVIIAHDMERKWIKNS